MSYEEPTGLTHRGDVAIACYTGWLYFFSSSFVGWQRSMGNLGLPSHKSAPHHPAHKTCARREKPSSPQLTTMITQKVEAGLIMH